MSEAQLESLPSRESSADLPIACVDLFCGAGGLTQGIIQAGIPVVAGVDFEAACEYPYRKNHPNTAFHRLDVASLEAETVAGWFGRARVRVLAGCAPCQPFSSYASRYHKTERSTSKDDRWGLLQDFGRLATALLPDVVTMENVPTVTRHIVFAEFESTLRDAGYKVWSDVVDCAQYGLPQRRKRTVLLASLHGEIKLRARKVAKTRTVADAIKGLAVLRHGGQDSEDPLHAAARLSDLNLERIRHSRQGGTWRDWPDELVAPCHKRNTGKTYPGVYGRMVYSEPAPTLTTQFFGFGNGRFGHPTQARGISLREGALLQGFPEDYEFLAPDKPVRFKALGRMIGNAVPVDLGRAIGESILAHVNENRNRFSSSSASHK